MAERRCHPPRSPCAPHRVNAILNAGLVDVNSDYSRGLLPSTYRAVEFIGGARRLAHQAGGPEQMKSKPTHGGIRPRRWSRLELMRYGLVGIALSVGVWQFDTIIAVSAAAVAYVVAPFITHPIDAWHYQLRRRVQRRYAVSLTRSGYGDSVDLGEGVDQIRRAIAGELRPFRVFISSTFSDLATERDLLAKDVFPRIAKECEKRDAIWAPIDLRWGITELQQNAGDVLSICLDSVERSRPNTIGIVGSRYGTHVPFSPRDRGQLPSWVTEGDGLSVTHLELRYASQVDPSALSVFVMDRQPASDVDGAGIASLLGELHTGGAQVVSKVTTEHDLAELVHSDLLRRLDQESPETGFDNSLLREISAHAAAERRLAERPNVNSEVLREAAGHLAERKIAVLRGQPGSGRSTLMAAWAHAWRHDHPDDIVITRFVGLTDASQTWPQILRSVVAEISLRTGQPMKLPPRRGTGHGCRLPNSRIAEPAQNRHWAGRD